MRGGKKIILATLAALLWVLSSPLGAEPGPPSSSSRAAPSARATGSTVAPDRARLRDQRLERARRDGARRASMRAVRRDDIRRALRLRLGRAFRDQPLPPEVTPELARHAKALATLYRLQTVAAQAEDLDAVVAVDELLASERATHERWWQKWEQPRAEEPEP